MQLRKSKTKYLLISASNLNSEDRHIFDIAHGVLNLEAAEIRPEDVELIIDHRNTNVVQKILRDWSNYDYKIYDSEKINYLLSRLVGYENLVVIFTGHGR